MEQKPSVLIVEDNERNRRLFHLVIHSMGCETRLAENGAEGLRMVEAALPDLILLDIQMPVLDGMTVIAKLREEERTRLIPVVAVTSFAMPGDRERLLAAGFIDYLSKPIDTQLLIQTVERHLPARPDA